MVQNFAYNDEVDKLRHENTKTFTDDDLVTNSYVAESIPAAMNYKRLHDRLPLNATMKSNRPFHAACQHQQKYRFEKIDPNVRVSHFPIPPVGNFEICSSSPDVFHEKYQVSDLLAKSANPVQRFKHIHSLMPAHHMCGCVCHSETTVHQSPHNHPMDTMHAVAKLKAKSLPRNSLHVRNLSTATSHSEAPSTHSKYYDSRSTEIVNADHLADLVVPHDQENYQRQTTEQPLTEVNSKSRLKCCKMSKEAIILVSVLIVMVVALTAGLLIFVVYGNAFKSSTYNSPVETLSFASSPQCGVFPDDFRRHKNNLKPAPKKLSHRAFVRQPRVLGGYNTKKGEFPWQVSLWLTREGMKCGGTLILKNWIITAAHCTNSYINPKAWTAYIGVTNLRRVNEPQVQKRNISSITQHHSFRGLRDDFDYDIAVMQLEKDLRFNSKIQPACIPPGNIKDDFTASLTCFVSGWGNTQNTESVDAAAILQHAQVDLFDTNTCKSFLGDLSNRMICAGKRDGSSDACKGDSGGPLSCISSIDNVWYLYGIVSWGKECGLPKAPGVYTQTSVFAEWIWDTIGKIEDY